MSTFKALSSIKSLKDALTCRRAWRARAWRRRWPSPGKLTDASMKLTEQTLAPMTARFSLAMEKFAKAA